MRHKKYDPGARGDDGLISFPEISRRLGIPVTTVYSLYTSAISKLANDPKAIIILTKVVESRYYGIRRNLQ